MSNIEIRQPLETAQKLVEVSSGQELWSEGALFHKFKRCVCHPQYGTLDRLAEVLSRGLLAPVHDTTGRVLSDVRIAVEGSDIPYDSVVFLHRYDPKISFLYSVIDPESVCVFLNPDVPVLTSEQMGDGWPVVSQDEVYSLQAISPDMLKAIMMTDSKVSDISNTIQEQLARISIPLFGTSGSRYY